MNLLTIKNRHIAACGVPPQFDPDEVLWLSYFENPDREQSVFLVTKDKKALVYIGDMGWEKPIEIEVQPFGVIATDRPTRVVVNKMTGQPLTECWEAAWIFVCWDASYWARGDKDPRT